MHSALVMMMRRHAALLAVGAACVGMLAPSRTTAAHPAPFDMTGHWTGASRSSKGNGTITADFTAAADRKTFTGTFQTLNARGGGGTFTVQGTLSSSGKVVVDLTSTDSTQTGTAVAAGTLKRTTGTVKGTYHSQQGGSNKDHGVFTLTKQ